MEQLSLLAHGLIPYRDVAISYPPLFLYSLYPFYVAGGANLASVPIIVSDAATAVVVYLIVERMGEQRTALAAGLVYALSPFALFYESYVWFSSQPMTLFAVLGVYFLIRDKPLLSFSTLALAVLFKQEAIFLLPVFLAVFVRRNPRMSLEGLTAFFGILIAVSLPFLIASVQGYLSLVTYGLVGGRWSGAPLPLPVTNSAICRNVLTNIHGIEMSCTFGSTTYTQVVANLPPSVVLINQFSYDLNVLSALLALPLLLLMTPVLYSLRRSERFVPLLCLYSGAGFLILFALTFHPVFKYYYMPVYAMLALLVANKGTFGVAMLAPIISLVTPSGAFQELLPILSIFAIAILLDASPRAPYASGSPPTGRFVRDLRPSTFHVGRERTAQREGGCIIVC